MSLNLDKSVWKRVALGVVAKHVTDRVDAETSGLDRFLAGEHIPSNDLAITHWGVIGRDPIGPMFYKRFKPGHVLYVSRRSYLRKTAVPEFEGITGEKTFVLASRDESVLLQRFLPFVLSAEVFHSYAVANSRGSVNPYINWTELANYEFELPSLNEQQRLADLLWAIERHRKTVPLLSLLRAEAGMLRSLTANQAGDLRAVGDLGSVLMGRQRSPEHETGDHMVPYLRVANVGDNELRMADVRKMNFTPSEQKLYALRPGDILVSEGQSRELVGQSALVESLPEPMFFQNTLIRFRADPEIIRPEYAQAVFRSRLLDGTFADMATRTTSIAHLGLKRFAGLQVLVPGLAEQDEFLARFASIRAGIDAAKQEKDALVNLRQALLGEIFGSAE